MKRSNVLPLSIAALSIVLILPASALAGNVRVSQDSQNTTTPPRGEHEALRMVPARAALNGNLDADKVKPGTDFHATISQKVQLDNGPELPAGTVLIGKVSKDDMNEGGTSKLALRFTHAKLKDGQVVPIKATIVGVYPPRNMSSEDYPIVPGDEVPNTWNDGTLQVDQISVLSGIDLHSKIASRNSGVLVSSKKDDVKLADGSEFALAIAQQHHHMKGMQGMGAMSQNSDKQ